jgi:hypothetical protein
MEDNKYLYTIYGANPLNVCSDVQRYLRDKYNMDFITSRKKIFPLAKKIRYENESLVTVKQLAEDLYDMYIKARF